MTRTNFLQETYVYVSRMREFNSQDWLVYVLWIGLMSGLLFAVSGFVLAGHFGGVFFPTYVWNLPVGTFIFVLAIAVDTIGHRTIYKLELQKGEALVHHLTIFAGITSCLLLCLAYSYPVGLKVPVFVMVGLSILYSIIDEAFHWRRYLNGHSDRVEMWSHFFILTGHSIMILSWCWWYLEGYPGVKDILLVLKV